MRGPKSFPRPVSVAVGGSASFRRDGGAVGIPSGISFRTVVDGWGRWHPLSRLPMAWDGVSWRVRLGLGLVIPTDNLMIAEVSTGSRAAAVSL